MILEVNIKFIYFEHFVNFKIQSKICTNKYYACTGNYECVYIYMYMYYKRNYMKQCLFGCNDCKNKTLFIKFFPFCMLNKNIKTLF